jgi:hypothetical protein
MLLDVDQRLDVLGRSRLENEVREPDHIQDDQHHRDRSQERDLPPGEDRSALIER